MTAPELNDLAQQAAESTARYEHLTNQARTSGIVFDYNAPLPDLHIRQQRSWEPAARHYRDLTDEERKEQNA